MKLSPNQIAPEFTALDHIGNRHTLSSYKGSWVILYFYPKDGTPGCTLQACSFRDAQPTLFKKAIVLGVSGDTKESHQRFATDHDLPFPLLIDPDKKIREDYDALGLFSTKRITYLIDPQGKIAKIYTNIDVTHYAQTIERDLSVLF